MSRSVLLTHSRLASMKIRIASSSRPLVAVRKLNMLNSNRSHLFNSYVASSLASSIFCITFIARPCAKLTLIRRAALRLFSLTWSSLAKAMLDLFRSLGFSEN